MRPVILIAIMLLLDCLCPAQQPDVRVQLWTLFRLSQLELQPVGKMNLAWQGGSSLQDMPLAIRAHGDTVEISGHTAAKLAVSGDFRMTAERAPAQHVRTKVEISAQNGALHVIASLPVEDYVAAVLQGETGGNMPIEALKALAVSIRSYTSRFRERHKDDNFDFCDTTHCQFLRLGCTACGIGRRESNGGRVVVGPRYSSGGLLSQRLRRTNRSRCNCVAGPEVGSLNLS